MAATKRQAGQVKDGKWLVLTESTGQPKEGFTHNCGAQILGKIVYHPIWDGPFALSGGGEVRTETVPYCPKCETEPDSRGAPIDAPFPGIAHKH